MRATWNGAIIAESDQTVVVEGNHYVPPESVNWEQLKPSDKRTRCPWKGQAHYWSVDTGERNGEDVAWSYPEPSAAARQITGHVAFWRGVVVDAS